MFWGPGHSSLPIPMDPSNLRSRWDRLSGDPAFRVGTVYAGASWFLIEAADTLGASTTLVRVLAGLLAVGFVVVVPTVWLLRRRSDAGEHSGSPRRRFLTPGRWSMALVALLVLSLGAWWVGGRRAPDVVPAAATQLAVLPFHVSGPDQFGDMGSGLVDLLSAAMDDVVGIRTVSSRTVLARTGEDKNAAVPLEEALRVGRDVGASSILTGSLTAVGGRARLHGEVRSVVDGSVLASADAEGAADDILSLTDDLAVRLLREMWRSSDPIPAVRTAALTTSSPAALRSYLRGERLLRRMRTDSAQEAFLEAVAADSTFALAWARLAETAGWPRAGGLEESLERRAEYIDRAQDFADRLPRRERSFVRATALAIDGQVAAFDSLEAYVQRNPDDPYAWYLLGDTRLHGASLGFHSTAEIMEPFLQAVRLDSAFALGLVHGLDIVLERGDRAEFERLLRQYAGVASPEQVEGFRQQARIRWGDPDSVVHSFAREVRRLGPAPDHRQLGRLLAALGNRARLDPRVDAMAYVAALDSSLSLLPGDRAWQQRATQLISLNLLSLGRVEEGFRRTDDWLALNPPTLSSGSKALSRAIDRVMRAVFFEVPAEHVREDVALLERDLDAAPIIESILHYYYRQRGDHDRAREYDRAFPQPPGAPAVDSVGDRLIMDGWDRLLLGDTATAIDLIDRGVRRLGFHGIATYPVIIAYAEQLALRPSTRERGIRMLQWLVANQALYPARGFLALGRAFERAGELEQARSSYGQVLRLWGGADDFRQDEVREARNALIRLTREG